MKLSALGLAMLECLESFRAEAYPDSGGVLTIGYGHVKDVKAGDTCTLDQAATWLAEEVGQTEAAVMQAVTIPLTQHQFDALVIFAYNVGIGGMKGSSLVSLINQKFPLVYCAEHFLPWNKVNGMPSTGLTRRRRLERALFLDGVNP